MHIAALTATLGRPTESGELLADLHAQTRPPDEIVFSIISDEDAPTAPTRASASVIMSPRKGSCAQRNVALDHVAGRADIVIFFDDDFVPASNYVEMVERAFADDPSLVGVTGGVVADGITGPGYSRSEALAFLAADQFGARSGQADARPCRSLYGCNMAVRMSAVGALRFDERLPLYGWLEDFDFTYQLGRLGRLAKLNTARGVHRGVKRARTTGVRFGYSQIANPIYLLHKRTAPASAMLANIVRNLAANHARALAPEPFVDRLGRVRGNWLGIMDALRGRIRPERITEL